MPWELLEKWWGPWLIYYLLGNCPVDPFNKLNIIIFHSRKVTVLDCLEKCLKKGKGEEQGQAAICAVLLTLQLGTAEETEEILKQVQPLFVTIMTDTSASIKARTAVSEPLVDSNYHFRVKNLLKHLTLSDHGNSISLAVWEYWIFKKKEERNINLYLK